MTPQEWFALDRSDFMAEWYRSEYEATSYAGAAGRIQTLMHRTLERGHTAETRFERVLEVGGNVGEHLPFVKHSFDEYVLTDLFDNLDQESKASLARGGVRFEVADVEALQWPDASFDRVLHTCVLHHLSEPERALTELRRVLKPGGVADLFLPSDPGAMYRMAKFMGPVATARRKGLVDVKRLMDARDHRNHVGGLLRLIKFVFRDDEVSLRSYPLPKATWNTSLWFTVRVRRAAV